MMGLWFGRRWSIAMPSAGHERSGRPTVDRPPDHASRPGVESDGAVDISFSSRVLCHVGDPDLIGLVAVKLARDPIFCGRNISHATKLRPSLDFLNLWAMNQQLQSLWATGCLLHDLQ